MLGDRKESKMQLFKLTQCLGWWYMGQCHRQHCVRALWYARYRQHNSPNLTEVLTLNSRRCHLELFQQALKAGHRDPMLLRVFNLLSEPLKTSCPLRKSLKTSSYCVCMSSFMCMNTSPHLHDIHVQVSYSSPSALPEMVFVVDFFEHRFAGLWASGILFPSYRRSRGTTGYSAALCFYLGSGNLNSAFHAFTVLQFQPETSL